MVVQDYRDNKLSIFDGLVVHEIEYNTVSFYTEKEETDEEYENRLKRETEAKELVEKVKFET